MSSIKNKNEQYFDKLEGFKSSFLSEYKQRLENETQERIQRREEELSNILSIENFFVRMAIKGSIYTDEDKVKENK